MSLDIHKFMHQLITIIIIFLRDKKMSAHGATAKFVPIATLIQTRETVVGKFIRTIGELHEHNIQKEQLVLKDTDSDSTLVIDSSLIQPFPFRQRILYQFIGEARHGTDNQVILRAYVYRCVEGLNLELYKQSHELRSCSHFTV